MQSLVSPPPVETTPADPGSFATLLVQSDLIALALARGESVLFANAAFCRLFGRSDDLAGTPVAALVAPAHRNRVASILRAAVRAPAICVAEVLRNDRRMTEVELHARELVAGGETLCAIFAQDVSDRSRAAARLSLLAFSDPLTGLANRALFADRLRQAALDGRRDGRSFALIVLDLDGFKPINDTHGHAAGDAVLQQVAQRLLGSMRAAETVARLGGDEFAVLLPLLKQRADSASVTERLLAAIRQPIAIGDLRLTISATAGIAVFPEHGNTVERLLVAADTALYTAKHQGGGHCAWASQDMPADVSPPTIVWSVAHEVGVPAMDAQHARLAGLLNELAAALHDGRDPRPAFGEFIRYAAHHFAAEERLMAQAAYANAAAHRDTHQRLLADVSGLALEGEDVSASLILRYLQEWLFRHVDSADRELAAVLLADRSQNSLPP
jgi:diguanylate cyclase (GGDEF)-like protein/hemerythrin-like metal-binding protein/PAS domain S-box-containing protein